MTAFSQYYWYIDFNTYDSEDEREAHILSLRVYPFEMVQRGHPDWSVAKIRRYIISNTVRVQREIFISQQVYHKYLHPELTQEEIEQIILTGARVRMKDTHPQYHEVEAEVSRAIKETLGDPPEEWFW